MLKRLYRKAGADTLMKDISLVFIVQFIGYPMGFLVHVFLARWAGITGYGDFIFTRNWITLIGVVGTLGFFGAAMKFVSLYYASGKRGELRGFMRVSVVMTVLATLLLQGLAMLFLVVFPPPEIDTGPVIGGLILSVLFALHTLYTDVLRALRYVLVVFIPADLLRPLLMLSFAFIFIQVIQMEPTTGAIVAFGLSLVLVLLIQVVMAAVRLRVSQDKKPIYHLREWGWFALETLLFRGTMIVRIELPAILIGFLLGGPAVGLFVIADRAAYLSAFVFTAVRRIFEPLIAPLYEAGKMAELQYMHARLTRWTFFLTMMVAGGIALFSDVLLSIFGEEFVAARPLLLVMVAGQVFNAATGQAGSVLRFTGHERVVRYIALVSLVIMVCVTLAGIVWWGLIGAAIGVTVAVVVQNTLFYMAVWHYQGLYLPWRTFIPVGRLYE